MFEKTVAALVSLTALILVAGPSIVAGQEAVSEVPEIMVAAVTKLPEGPRPARQEDNCSNSLIDPKTAAGRLVQQRGWGVMSEVGIGDYQLVSFAGEFIPGTSGSCAIRQGTSVCSKAPVSRRSSTPQARPTRSSVS